MLFFFSLFFLSFLLLSESLQSYPSRGRDRASDVGKKRARERSGRWCCRDPCALWGTCDGSVVSRQPLHWSPKHLVSLTEKRARQEKRSYIRKKFVLTHITRMLYFETSQRIFILSVDNYRSKITDSVLSRKYGSPDKKRLKNSDMKRWMERRYIRVL